MRIFQGWKVRFYTFVSVFLFITGATVALWPHNSVTYNQNNTSNTETVQTIAGASQDEKKTVEVAPADSGEPVLSAEESSPLEDMTNGTSVPPAVEGDTTPPAANPAPVVIPDSKPDTKHIVPSVTGRPPVVTPKKCGCAVSQLDNIVCPLTGGLLNASLCKLEY